MSAQNKPYTPRPGSKPDLFLELADPDEKGFSRKVYVAEFVGKYERLQMGNGGDWCRDDGALGKHYNIKRHLGRRGIDYIQLHGRKKKSDAKPIPNHIRKQISIRDCVVLAVSKVETDHKDGRRDDPRLNDINKVILDDFQPLSKAANTAKRQHCKTCRRTGQRFDATKLGYSVSQVRGNGVYRGTCIGCYWHDPIFFNKTVSSDFKGY